MEGDGMLSQDEINALLNGMDLSAGGDDGNTSADSGSSGAGNADSGVEPVDDSLLSEVEKDAIGEVANSSSPTLTIVPQLGHLTNCPFVASSNSTNVSLYSSSSSSRLLAIVSHSRQPSTRRCISSKALKRLLLIDCNSGGILKASHSALNFPIVESKVN